MTQTLLKKDYMIIGTSTKNPNRVIVEVDKNAFEKITSRKRMTREVSLRDYIKTWEIDNTSNISPSFWTVDELIDSMK